MIIINHSLNSINYPCKHLSPCGLNLILVYFLWASYLYELELFAFWPKAACKIFWKPPSSCTLRNRVPFYSTSGSDPGKILVNLLYTISSVTTSTSCIEQTSTTFLYLVYIELMLTTCLSISPGIYLVTALCKVINGFKCNSVISI